MLNCDKPFLPAVTSPVKTAATTATMAYSFLEDYTPLIAEISEVIPQVALTELLDESEIIHPDAVKESIKRTQTAWDGEHAHKGHEHDLTATACQ